MKRLNGIMRLKRFLSLLLAMTFLVMAALPPSAGALEVIDTGGIIQEEGECISSNMWTKDDWINVATEVVTSGGTASYELVYLGMKYVVTSFFSVAVTPTEFWLRFLQEWRYDTGLRAPEDFKMLTGQMMDNKLDVFWLAKKCSDLSEKEGWDHVFNKPWVIKAEAADLSEGDGDMALTPSPSGGATSVENSYTGSDPSSSMPAAAPAGMEALAGVESIDPTAGASIVSAAAATATDSKLFEKSVNVAAIEGRLAHLGIPKGAKWFNFSYSSSFGVGVHGPDGFFMDRATGKCYLLEMKWSDKGSLGSLHVPYNGKKARIIQGSPQWLQKALLKVREQDPERFQRMMRRAGDFPFSHVMESVDKIAKNKHAIIEHILDGDIEAGKVERTAEAIEAAKNRITHALENFSDPDILKRAYEHPNVYGSGADDAIKKIFKFWDEDFFFRAVNRTGNWIGRLGTLATSTGDYIKMLHMMLKNSSDDFVKHSTDMIKFAGIRNVGAKVVRVFTKKAVP